MEPWFSDAALCDFADDCFRNIVSLKTSQDLFDDLSDDPLERLVAEAAEIQAKPGRYGPQPILHRPFEEAEYLAAIDWPFRHWAQSRYSDGRFGVWYGALDELTTVHETVYHWRSGFLADAGFERGEGRVVAERKLYRVRTEAVLIDLRPVCRSHPGLLDGADYRQAQDLGERLSRQGHPGLVSRSARGPGEIVAIFNAAVLSNPRVVCYLRYSLDRQSGDVDVYRGVDRLCSLPA